MMKFTANFRFQREKLQDYHIIKNDTGGRLQLYVKAAAHPDGEGGFTTTTELARKLSVGTDNIPPRPFFKDYRRVRAKWLRSVIKDHLKLTKTAVHSAQGSGGIKTVVATINWTAVSKLVTKDIKTWIAKGDYYRAKVPNSPYTVAMKGHDTPLVDTGALVESIHTRTVK